jgi:flagellar hook-associated protein 1 FlgK
MPTIFHGLVTAYSGLQAMQAAIQTTSQNITNAETKGYSRQTAILAPNDPYTLPHAFFSGTGAMQMGSGVVVAAMGRARDQFIDRSMRLETGVKGEAQANYQGLQRVEAAFNEIEGDGLTVQLTKFYDSWQELALHPDNLATRTAVAQTAKDVSGQFNTLVNTIRRAQRDTDEQMDLVVGQINRDLQSVAQLNKRITESIDSGDQPNDLLDQRDLLLDGLAEYGNFRFVPVGNSINVTLNGFYCVDKDSVAPLQSVYTPGTVKGTAPMQFGAPLALAPGEFKINGVSIVDVATPSVPINTQLDLLNLINAKSAQTGGVTAKVNASGELELSCTGDGTQTISVDVNGNALRIGGMPNGLYQVTNAHEIRLSNGQTAQISSGQLSGMIKTVQQDAPSFLQRLDQLANTIITRVNGLHSSGYNLEGQTGVPFFTGTQAKDMQVAGNLIANVRMISAAVNPQSTPGDGNRALDIAALKNAPLMSGRTTEDYYNNLLSEVGFAVAQAGDKSDNQDQILKGIEDRRQEVQGVSLDEEFANLIRFQRAYQGASRMVSVMDEMMQQVLSMGLVGR